jgi:large subunit ribosomal protein L15
MMIHEVTVKVGKYKNRKRVGRGPGSGTGKTCGRGHKGAWSRAGAGGSMRASYEGGQMPLFRRIPKRGFTNVRFRTEFEVVNVGALAARFEDGDEVNAKTLSAKGLIGGSGKPVKILGTGSLEKKLEIAVNAFSDSARQKITRAGGTATVG